MKRRFELDVLRIEELGEGPFTFTVWVNDVLQEPSHNDRVPLPRSGILTVHICTDDSTVGAVKVPLNLISHNTCCWLPLDFSDVLTELVDKVVGPRAMVSFTNIDLLSPVSEHGSLSERSCDERGLESPSILRRKVQSLVVNDEDGLKRTLNDLLSTIKAYSEQKAELKRNVLRQDRELQAVKLSLAQERTIYQHKLSSAMDDRSLENEKLRILAKSLAADLKDITLKYEAVISELEDGRIETKDFRIKSEARVKELEGKLADSLARENKATSCIATLTQEVTELRKTQVDYNSENSELKATLWRLKSANDLPKVELLDERIPALQSRLEESERQRAALMQDMHQMKDFIEKLECQEGATQAASLRIQVSQLGEEVQRLTEELADAQEEAIRLQSYEDYAPLSELKTHIAKINNKASSDVEAAKKQFADIRRSYVRLNEHCNMLTADLASTQRLLLSKQRYLHSVQVDALNLRSQLEVFNSSRDTSIDTDRALKEYMHSNGYRSTISKLGEGIYVIGNKRLRLVLKNDRLLVRTGGGYTYFDDYIKAEKTDFTSELKKCPSAASKSFSSNRSSSAGLFTRNLENFISNFNDAKDSDTTVDYDNIMLQSFTLDETSYRRCANVQQSPKVDLTKPTKSSIGKRADRTPLKPHNVGVKTPGRSSQKRIPFKM